MKNSILVLISFMAVLLTTFTAQAIEQPNCTKDSVSITYKVNKMHCANCEQSLVDYFSKQPNVVKASADYKAGCLKIEWAKGITPMKTADLATALDKMGYEYAETVK